MVNKKKTEAVAYVPISQASQITPIIDQKVLEIPRYEDSGIRFQGKYKTQKGLNEYELKGQQTRFYALPATAAGLNSFTRENKNTTVFYCTKIIVQYQGKAVIGPTVYDTLYDYVNGSYNLRFLYWPVVAAESIVYDFTDCPRKFQGDFVMDKATAGGTDTTVILLFGWEEQL